MGITITALVTPLCDDGSVNYKRLTELIDFQAEEGADGVVLLGTTGEAPTMTEDERGKIISEGIKAADGRIKIIVGCGSNDTKKTAEMCRRASELGADAVLVLTPYYNKANDEGMIRHFTEAADASDVPVIIYNVPSRTGCSVSINALRVLSRHENIIGIKEASGNVSFAAKIAPLCSDDFFMLCGCDDLILPYMSLGARGVISVASNIIPREICGEVNAFSAGNLTLAREIHNKYINLINSLFSEVNPIPVKEAMNYLGFDVGGYRLPLCEMSQDAKKALVRELVSCGLAEEAL